MAERCDGRIKEVPKSHRFKRNQDLKRNPLNGIRFYNTEFPLSDVIYKNTYNFRVLTNIEGEITYAASTQTSHEEMSTLTEVDMGESRFLGACELPSDAEAKPRCIPAWTWACSRDVHIWCAPLMIAELESSWLSLYLSHDEAKRASEFLCLMSRNQFILGRVMTRLVLASLRDLGGDHVDVFPDSRGKPILKVGHESSLRFSISHSGQYVLIAFALHREVGIDVEVVQRTDIVTELGKYLYAPDEATFLHALSPVARAHEFFQSWCRKEAIVKGLGYGLSIPLAEFTLIPTDLANSHIFGVDSASVDVGCWRVYDIRVDHRHLAALAIEGPVSNINVWKISKNADPRIDVKLNFDCEIQYTRCSTCVDG